MTLTTGQRTKIELQAWRGFRGHAWQREVDVAGFIRAIVRTLDILAATSTVDVIDDRDVLNRTSPGSP